MSTSYRAFGSSIADANEAGWESCVDDTGAPALKHGRNYAHEVEEVEIEGQRVLVFERYGRNDVSDLVVALGASSEHDEDFWTKHELAVFDAMERGWAAGEARKASGGKGEWSPLSGEWASESINELLGDLLVDATDEQRQEILDAYEENALEAYNEE
jgi:hypothetical protein